MTHTPASIRRTQLLSTLCVLVFGLLGSVPHTPALARPTASVAPVNAAVACPRTQVVSEWEASYTVTYNVGATQTKGTTTRTASVGRTGSYGAHYGGRYGNDGSLDIIRWMPQSASGTAAINDKLDVKTSWGGYTASTVGSGSISESPGFIEVDPATCTYAISSRVEIEATDRFGTNEPRTEDYLAFYFTVYDRAINEATGESPDLTIRGSANIAAPISTPAPETDTFQYGDGSASGDYLNIKFEEGAPNLGLATVSWVLKPVAPQPKIVDVQLEERDPETGDWVPLDGDETVDGNTVKVVAEIDNPTDANLTLPVRFMDQEKNELLPSGGGSYLLPAQSTTPVEYEWSTEGWAWEKAPDATSFAAGDPTPHHDRKLEVKLGLDANLYDAKQKPVRVVPKPVILVHGLNSNAGTWAAYNGFLHEISFAWNAFPITTMATGNDPVDQQASVPIRTNGDRLRAYVEQIRKQERAERVDIVAHSMGGLISRLYIHAFMPLLPDGRPVVDHLVMLGTPNQGSYCAEILLGMNVNDSSPNIEAPSDLVPGQVALFNQGYTNQKGVKMSVLAGNTIPFTCRLSPRERGDGVVTVPSAHWTFSDIGLTDSNHIEMTGSHADFVNWVKPHLLQGAGTEAQGARATAAADMLAVPVENTQFLRFARQTVAAGATVEIPVTVPQASAWGVTLQAPAGVSAALVSPSGAVVDSEVANSERAQAAFRSLIADAPAVGTWKVRLQNTGGAQAKIALAALVDGSALKVALRAGAPAADGRVVLTATLTGAGATGATVTAKLSGAGVATTLALLDDGQHGDGAAGDGVYGALTAPLADGSYGALATVSSGSTTLMAVAPIAVGTVERLVFLPLVAR